MSSRRSRTTVVSLLILAACTGSSTVNTEPPAATAEEVAIFCERYAEVRDQSRQEVLLALLDVTPQEIYGAVKRASERNGSFEDDDKIDAFIDRCGGP